MPKLLISFLAFLVMCTAVAQKKYEIIGHVAGFADSTKIFLDTMNVTRAIVVADSTYITDGSFQFTGSIKEDVSQVMIRTKNFEDYKFMWLSNEKINFSAEKGKFRSARITGSKVQNESDLYDSVAGNDRNKSFIFIESHPNSIVSAHVLSVYASTWGRDTAMVLYKKLSPAMQSSTYGKDVAEFIALNKNPKIGDRYVDFTQENVQGKQVSLSDFSGKVVLLDFWGSWCGPCRANNVELVKIYKEFKDTGFEILGVAADGDRAAWLAAIAKDQMTWPNVTDFNGPKNKAAIAYGINKYPTNYLIDKKGTLVAMDLYGDDLRTEVRQYLDAKN